MIQFTDCSGECAVCACGDACAAGHGDDDYCPASKEQLISRLRRGRYAGNTQLMIDTLKQKFDYSYENSQDDETRISLEGW